MNTSLSSYTPLESLLLFNQLQITGVTNIPFNDISQLLEDVPAVHNDPAYDKTRLSPDALRQLYLGLLKDQARRDLDEDGVSTPNTNATANATANPRKRRAPTPNLPTVEEAAKHVELVPKLLIRLYETWREKMEAEIREEERNYMTLSKDIEAIERGEWDEKLRAEHGIKEQEEQEEQEQQEDERKSGPEPAPEPVPVSIPAPIIASSKEPSPPAPRDRGVERVGQPGPEKQDDKNDNKTGPVPNHEPVGVATASSPVPTVGTGADKAEHPPPAPSQPEPVKLASPVAVQEPEPLPPKQEVQTETQSTASPAQSQPLALPPPPPPPLQSQAPPRAPAPAPTALPPLSEMAPESTTPFAHAHPSQLPRSPQLPPPPPPPPIHQHQVQQAGQQQGQHQGQHQGQGYHRVSPQTHQRPFSPHFSRPPGAPIAHSPSPKLPNALGQGSPASSPRPVLPLPPGMKLPPPSPVLQNGAPPHRSSHPPLQPAQYPQPAQRMPHVPGSAQPVERAQSRQPPPPHYQPQQPQQPQPYPQAHYPGPYQNAQQAYSPSPNQHHAQVPYNHRPPHPGPAAHQGGVQLPPFQVSVQEPSRQHHTQHYPQPIRPALAPAPVPVTAPAHAPAPAPVPTSYTTPTLASTPVPAPASHAQATVAANAHVPAPAPAPVPVPAPALSPAPAPAPLSAQVPPAQPAYPPYSPYSHQAPAAPVAESQHTRLLGGIVGSLKSRPSTWKSSQSPQPLRDSSPPQTLVRPTVEPLSPVQPHVMSPPAQRQAEDPQQDKLAVPSTESVSKAGRPLRKSARRSRAGSTASSVVASSARGRTRSHSVASHAGSQASHAQPSTARKVKDEPMTPAEFPSHSALGDIVETPVTSRTKRSRRSKRKRSPSRDSLSNDETAAVPSKLASLDAVPVYVPPRSDVIVASRNFQRLSAVIMNDITTHKHAGPFQKPVREKDAEGYGDIIKRPQDLKSIKAAITTGSRTIAAIAAKDTADSPAATPSANSSREGGTVVVERTVEVLPPRAIVNSSQLEKEVMRMFANAVMFNPGDAGMVQDAREMADDIEAKVRDWRGAERHVEGRGGGGGDDDEDTLFVGTAKRRKL